MPDDFTKRGSQDRSKIAMHEEHEVHYWTKHLGVSREELQRAVDKVGNSAAAVRKSLENNRLVRALTVRYVPESGHRRIALALRGFTFRRGPRRDWHWGVAMATSWAQGGGDGAGGAAAGTGSAGRGVGESPGTAANKGGYGGATTGIRRELASAISGSQLVFRRP